MPQMAPMSWTILFLFFSAMLIMVATMNYFSYMPMMKEIKNKQMNINNSLNWKW